MYFGFDQSYYQQPYAAATAAQVPQAAPVAYATGYYKQQQQQQQQQKKKYLPQYQSDFNMILNGVQNYPEYHYDDANYIVQRSYSAPDDEYNDYNVRAVYVEPQQYYYNAPPKKQHNYLQQPYQQQQQQLQQPPQQQYVYDYNDPNIYYAYHSRPRKQESDSLKSLETTDNINELKAKLKEPNYIKDPYVRHMYEKKLRELQAKQAQRKPEAKRVAAASARQETESERSVSESSEISVKSKTRQEKETTTKETKQETSDTNQQDADKGKGIPPSYRVHDKPLYTNYEKSFQKHQSKIIGEQVRNYLNQKTDAHKGGKRVNGPPVFIPPDPDQLLRPTLRGAPFGFNYPGQTANRNPQPNANPDAPKKTEKAEVDKLRAEVKDLEKELKNLKKSYSISSSSSSESDSDEDVKSTAKKETPTVSTAAQNEDKNNKEKVNERKLSENQSPKKSTRSRSISNVSSLSSLKTNTKSEQTNKSEVSDDDSRSSSDSESSSSSSSDSSTTERQNQYYQQSQQQQQQQQQQQLKYGQYQQNSRIHNQQNYANPYSGHSHNAFDYYELDAKGNLVKLDKRTQAFLLSEQQKYKPHGYNDGSQYYNYSVNPYGNYPVKQSSKFNKYYSEYQRADYNKIYNVYSGMKAPENDKKSKKDDYKKFNQKSSTQDGKKVFGPSERALQEEIKRKETTNLIENLPASSSAAAKPNKKRYNSDKASVAGSIFDVPLPSDNVSEYSAFVNNVFSKALDK